MSTTSTQSKRYSVIQGDKGRETISASILTHNDIKEFFACFAGAILVDQKRVNKLPSHSFHPEYYKGMWKRNRSSHVYALIQLSKTVDAMPQSLLKEVTQVSLDYRPAVMNQHLLNFISDLATQAEAPWLYETSSLIFGELIKAARRKPALLPSQGDPKALLAKWFDYDDPIRIACDPECQYQAALASYIRRETQVKRRARAERAKSRFYEMLQTSIDLERYLAQHPELQ